MIENPSGPVEGYVARRSRTATKTNTPLIDTPQAISVIPREVLREQGAGNLRDTLRYSAGVYAHGTDSRADWAMIRGIAFTQYQDGLRALFGYYNSPRPDVWNLERVEILKGPASVLYGAGSFGGTVNLVSKRPLDEARRAVELSLGNHARRQLAVDFTGPLNENRTLLYRLVALGRLSGTQVEHVPDDRALLAPSLTWRPSPDTEATIHATWQRDRTGSTTGFFPWSGLLLDAPNGPIDTARFMSEPGFDDFSTRQKALGWSISHRINTVWSFNHGLRWSDSSARYRSIYSRFPRPRFNLDARTINRNQYQADNSARALTADTRVQADWKLAELDLTTLLGWDWQDVTLDTRSVDADFPALDVYTPVYTGATEVPMGPLSRTRQRQSGLYAQQQIKWGGRWLALMGVRHDRVQSVLENGAPGSGYETGATTGRLGLAWVDPAGVTAYANLSQAFQPLAGQSAAGAAWKPQTALQVEFGVKWQPTGGSTSVTAAIFQINERNRLMSDPTNPQLQAQLGQVRVQGLELEGTTALGARWDAIASFSHLRTKILQGDAAQVGSRLPTVPGTQAALWGRYRAPVAGGLLSVGAGLRYVGSAWDGSDTLRTPPITLADAMVGYETGPWRLTLTVNNLADRRVVSNCLARGDCFFGARRSVVANLRYAF